MLIVCFLQCERAVSEGKAVTLQALLEANADHSQGLQPVYGEKRAFNPGQAAVPVQLNLP